MRLSILMALLAATLLGTLMSNLPLLSVPSYESGLATGLLAASLSCALSFRQAARRPAVPTLRWGVLETSPAEAVYEEVRFLLPTAAGLVAIPLFLLVSAAASTDCRVAPGLGPFLLVAVPASYGGLAMGCLLGSLTRKPRLAVTIAVVFVTASMLLTLAEGLAGPRHTVHDILLGPITFSAFMGHDQGLSFPGSVYRHRVLGILFFTALLACSAWLRCVRDRPVAPSTRDEETVAEAGAPEGDPPDDGGWRDSRADDDTRIRFLMTHHRRGPRRLLALLLLLASPFLLSPHGSGLLSGRANLEDQLSGLLETEHFRIHFAPGTLAEAHLPRLAVEHEWAFEQVADWLELEAGPKVDSYIHPSGPVLHELTGARGYVFAAPWNRELHLSFGRRGTGPLRHELVHVLAGEFGSPPFRASVRAALIEGLATSLDEGQAREPEAHQAIAAAHAAGHVPTAEELTSLLGFAQGNMDRAYRSSASFVGWLLLEHGPEPFKKAYAWGDFEAAYGMPISELGAAWFRFLEEDVHPPGSVAARARERFDPAREPAFYRQTCPRLGRTPAPGAPLERARLLSRAGVHDDAASAYCEAFLSSADPLHLEAAAGERRRAGALASSLHLLERVLAAPGVAPGRLPGLHQARAINLARMGRWEDAELALEEAVRFLWRPSAGGREPPSLPFERLRGNTVPSSLLDGAAPDALLESIFLDALAVRSSRHKEAYFEARMSEGTTAATLLRLILESDPEFTPAQQALLAVERAESGHRGEAQAVLARRFAATSTATPLLAARHLLRLAREADRAAEWERSAALHGEVLGLTSVRAVDALEARDGRQRALMAPKVRWFSSPAQPPARAGRWVAGGQE